MSRKNSKLPTLFDTPWEIYKREGEELGQGGVGAVYRVVDSLGRGFALKLLKEEVQGDRARRFRNEAALLASLSHPNIVSVVDQGYIAHDDGKRPFIVMPLFSLTLRKLMKGGISADAVLGLFNQVLDGVEAAHKRNTWHRDLKPENILFDPGNDLIAVADFGIAHIAEELLAAPVKTTDGTLTGNFAYAAPEQRKRGVAVDWRADIYSLGLILHEMFTAQLAVGTGRKLIGRDAPGLNHVDAAVEAMLSLEPESRPQTIGAVRELLGLVSSAEPRDADSVPNAISAARLKPSEPDSDWLDRHSVNAVHALDRAKQVGFWEGLLSPPAMARAFGRAELLEAAREAQIHGTGWPIGVFIDSQPSEKPRPDKDGIVAVVSGPDQYFDYWAVGERGHFYVLRNLQPLDGGDDSLVLESPIWNATQLMLYADRLYAGLGLPPGERIAVNMRYSGLTGRALASGAAPHRVRGERVASVGEVRVQTEFALGAVDDGITERVIALVKPVLELFDFFSLSEPLYEQIIVDYRRTVGALGEHWEREQRQRGER